MSRYLLFVGLLIVATSCVLPKNKSNDKMNTERLTHFSYEWHNAMAESGVSYDVTAMKDGRVHVVIDKGFSREKEFYLDDNALLGELLTIVKKYEMDKYESYYQPEMEVYDGTSWRLSYSYDSGRIVSSGGYMASPDNYREAVNEVSGCFRKWRENGR